LIRSNFGTYSKGGESRLARYRIVRRKTVMQGADTIEGHKRIMSPKTNAGIALLAVAVCSAATVVWLRIHTGRPSAIFTHRTAEAIEKQKVATTGAFPTKDFSLKKVPGTDKPVGDVKAEIAGMPLKTGEVLEFTANVSKLSNVASLQVSVVERRSFLGKTVWHLQATAHTENPLRMVLALDDQFDSYSDAGALTSLQYEMHLNERGQKVESVQRMMTSGRAPADATAAMVLPGTRDPLGMLEYLRSVDWANSGEVRSPVYDGRKLYDVRARLTGSAEKVTVPAGNYITSKIELRVFDNGTEMKDSHFFLYLANNSTRSPVLLEALLPFADARVELVKSQ
jgi:Protein of unknown function (DUF3108)